MKRQSDLVIVANRLPVRRRRKADREFWDTSPGGLVSALMPILRRESERGAGGAWVGWSGARTRSFEPFEHEGVWNAPINVSKALLAGYYDGMANGTLWPLYHDLVRTPSFERQWWQAYQAANRSFARATAELASPGARVWVHDYHLHLVPRLLREQRPDLRIGFFLHIPFPDRRLFAQLPWRREIVEGTLGADAIGFQTVEDAENFVDAGRRYVGATAGSSGLELEGRPIRVDAFPISIDTGKIDRLARSRGVEARSERHRRRLAGRKILLGVDRMDYTKGIPHRLRAFRELLRSGRVDPEEAVLIQSCVPTRERVDAYSDLRSQVEELVGQINGEFGAVGLGCVQYLRQNLPLDRLLALYRAADVALVTPVRDGMNLIAKEYVASRCDERGALVLSEFTGAAHELGEALIVNPHDLDQTAEALEQGLRMTEEEQRRRMRAMRATVASHDVYAWADSFLGWLSSERPQRRSQPSKAQGRRRSSADSERRGARQQPNP